MSNVGAILAALGAIWFLIIPLALIELGLMVWALVDVSRRGHVRGNNKIIWILVIVLVNIIGPILYFILGREEEPVEEERYEQ